MTWSFWSWLILLHVLNRNLGLRRLFLTLARTSNDLFIVNNILLLLHPSCSTLWRQNLTVIPCIYDVIIILFGYLFPMFCSSHICKDVDISSTSIGLLVGLAHLLLLYKFRWYFHHVISYTSHTLIQLHFSRLIYVLVWCAGDISTNPPHITYFVPWIWLLSILLV